jgi:diguanylate cyclase (GGDEF)-like protein
VTQFFTPSLVGLLVQASGALLMASMCLVLLRTVRREPLVYWSIAWLALFVGIESLWAAFFAGRVARELQTLYLFGEYVFGYFVIAGCRRYATGRRPRPREWWLVPIGLALAAWLPAFGGGNFNVFFAIHTLIFAYLFFVAWRILRRATSNPRSRTGVRIMRAALLALALVNLHYAPLFTLSTMGTLTEAPAYLAYTPLLDLILGFVLMFGMVMIATGDTQHELEISNLALGRALDRLETMSQIDPLTSTLNRHAFTAWARDPERRRQQPVRGCAAFVDLDDLKALNDRYGHAAGDSALQAAATALWSCLRSEDMLFRWGGDEFLILFVNLDEDEARARLAPLSVRLRQTTLRGAPQPVDLSASIGLAAFDDVASLDAVIAAADSEMYRHKSDGTRPLTPA